MNPTLREPVNRTPTKFTFTLLVSLSFALTASAADPQAGQPDLSKITSRTDIEAIIAATADGALKKSLTDHTDASAEHFKQLNKLKGIEIGCHEATAGLLKHFHHLPLEYVALSYGVNAPAADAIASARSISTLRRLSIDCESFTDDDLKLLAGLSQLEKLSLGRLPLTDKRIAQLQNFTHLKQLELAERRKDFRYSEDLKAKVKAALPGVEVKFVQ